MMRRFAWVAVVVAVVAAPLVIAAQPATAEDPAGGGSASGGSASGGSATAEDPASGGSAGGGSASGGSASGGSAGGGSASGGSAGGGSASGGSAGGGSASGGSAGAGSGSGVFLQLPPEIGAPDVSAAASPTIVSLGAHFTVYVTATFGSGVEVNLREPVELGAAFEVRRKLSEDRPSRDGRTTREWQIDVTPWELGDLRIAPIAVTFTFRGKAGQVQTNAVPLKIIGVLGDLVDDPSAMRGLAPPAGLSTRDWFWIGCATAAAAAVGVVIAALWLRGRRRRWTRQLVGGAIARPRRIDMTGERALERLLAIERSGALGRDAERKQGYADMVEVLRAYLADRYRIAVHDLTSSELLRRLAAAAPADEVALVAGWLAACDLVKYGGQRASSAEAGQALDGARALIVATTPSRATPRPAAQEAA